MPKASPIQTAFNAGEWSPRLAGRVDIGKYKNACNELENFIPMVHGGLVKRPGTRFVYEVKNSANPTILIPFEYSTDQAYILEFGDLYMRVYAGNAIVGAPYEIATPYTTADLDNIQFAQSADVLYIAHPSYAPRKLERTAATPVFTLTEITFNEPPFRDENADTSVTIYASAATGTGITLTASSATFTSDMVGGYVKLRELIGSKHLLWIDGEVLGSTGNTRRYEANVY